MKKNTMILAALIAAVALAGCNEENEVVQTVEWFKAHKAERDAQLEKCRANPGELAATPNCINASRADSSTTWSARGSGIKPLAPLTAGEMKNK